MKKYFKIQIEITSPEQAEILIALLSDIKYYAFDEEKDLLNAYVKEQDFDEKILENNLPADHFFTKQLIEEENWNYQWEIGIKPVIIKNFASIRPSFADPIKDVKYDLIITPKMSFGTGHHATTYLMVQMMQQIDFENRLIIDFGTGTGVLAILAEKCGASKVVGVDYDEWSINNAIENIEANNCQQITLKQQSNLEDMEAADILLANINLNVIKNTISSITKTTKSGSYFLASGFLITDEGEMQNIFEREGFVKKKTEQLDGWLAILFKKK